MSDLPNQIWVVVASPNYMGGDDPHLVCWRPTQGEAETAVRRLEEEQAALVRWWKAWVAANPPPPGYGRGEWYARREEAVRAHSRSTRPLDPHPADNFDKTGHVFTFAYLPVAVLADPSAA